MWENVPLDKPPSCKQDSSCPVARPYQPKSANPVRWSFLPYPVSNLQLHYADDLALWTSEKHISSASAQLQNALRSLESWLSKWLLKINEEKITYTSFTLSNKKQVAKLLLNDKALREDETSTYLGITLDRHMTW
jgi:hypothetical protein